MTYDGPSFEPAERSAETADDAWRSMMRRADAALVRLAAARRRAATGEASAREERA